MAHLNRKQIQKRAYELLEESTGGLRWSELLRRIHAADPETPLNTIQGSLHSLLSSNPPGISKVARGIYQLERFVDLSAEVIVIPDKNQSTDQSRSRRPIPLEKDFYQSFASWLVGTEEATIAEVIGGSVLRGKWATPDVMGVVKSRADDILKFPTQIVSAEIKTQASETVTAFGQSIAYRLFSHKSFIVVPNSVSEDDLARLKALCSLHGVGLITFSLDILAPDYSVIVPAQFAEPDMFYANQVARALRDNQSEVFHKFFS